MIVGFDIDGVLFPWDDCARDALVQKFGIERPEPSTSWNYLKGVIERAQWDWLWSAEGQSSVFSRVLCTYPDGVAAANALLKAGHRVHFVTHRDPRRTAIYTAMFLTLHFDSHPWAGVHVIQNSVQKRRLMKWDVFVDDKPETVHDFLAETDAMVFAPARPWNVDHIDNEFLYDDADEIVQWVEARS